MSRDRRAVREPLFTLANALTLVRIPLAFVIWLAPRRPDLLIPVMAAAAASDLLDGRVARWMRARKIDSGQDPGMLAEAGGVGSWLDPLCDKIFVLSLLGAVYWSHDTPLVVIALIATREIFLLPMTALYKLGHLVGLRRTFRADFRAGLLGKLATAGQFAAVAAILLNLRQVHFFAALAAVTGILATYEYTRRATRTTAPT
jgi:cardiolipin synthase